MIGMMPGLISVASFADQNSTWPHACYKLLKIIRNIERNIEGRERQINSNINEKDLKPFWKI